MSTINDAVELGLLRKYDLEHAKVGDRVLGFDPGSVIALHMGYVVFGWDNGSVTYFHKSWPHAICLSPFGWVDGVPVYEES